MPIYEYRCTSCRKRFSQLIGVTADSKEPVCRHCGSRDVIRLISRFSRLRSEDEKLDALEDAALAADDDPKAARRLMAEMAREMGEDLEEDVVDELLEEAEQDLEEEDEYKS